MHCNLHFNLIITETFESPTETNTSLILISVCLLDSRKCILHNGIHELYIIYFETLYPCLPKEGLYIYTTKLFLFGGFIYIYQFDSNNALILSNAYYVGIIMPKIVINSLLRHINQRVRLHNLLGSLVLTSSWTESLVFVAFVCFFDAQHAALLKTTQPRKYTHEIRPLSFSSLKVSVYSETK